MNTAPPVRTHHSPCVDITVQDAFAEHLRRAPWLALSAALHFVLLLLIWLLVPAEAARASQLEVDIALQDQPQLAPPEIPTPPEPEAERVPEIAPVVQPEVTADEPSDEAADDSSGEPMQSAFDFAAWNTAVGVYGDAGGRYGNRGDGNGSGRKGKGRGGRHTPDAAGLVWLAAHQDDDGKWDCDDFMKHDDPALPICSGPGNGVHDVGVTGLALLAFLGDNHTMRQGEYRNVVRKGVQWLLAQQQENGLFGGATSSDFVYDHAIAAYAICEAYGLSSYRLLKEPAQRALDYLETHRNPYRVFRYQPRDGDNDLSVTAWCLMAYEAGRTFGLAVSDQALAACATFLDEVAEPNGVHGYTRRGEGSSRKGGDHRQRFPPDKGAALTAVGLFCRFFLGQDPQQTPIMHAAAERLCERPPVWDERAGTIDHYYWYYATYALFQMGGPKWTAWQRHIDRAVARHQHRDPAQKNLYGSWDPAGAWGDDGGRVYSTAILTLTMQANHRYTRLIR